MENHPIDQLFKEKLGNFEQIPPVGLLDKISEQVVFRSKVRRINQIKAVVGIAAALVLVAMAGWFTVSRQDQFVFAPELPFEFELALVATHPPP